MRLARGHHGQRKERVGGDGPRERPASPLAERNGDQRQQAAEERQQRPCGEEPARDGPQPDRLRHPRWRGRLVRQRIEARNALVAREHVANEMPRALLDVVGDIADGRRRSPGRGALDGARVVESVDVLFDDAVALDARDATLGVPRDRARAVLGDAARGVVLELLVAVVRELIRALAVLPEPVRHGRRGVTRVGADAGDVPDVVVGPSRRASGVVLLAEAVSVVENVARREALRRPRIRAQILHARDTRRGVSRVADVAKRPAVW